MENIIKEFRTILCNLELWYGDNHKILLCNEVDEIREYEKLKDGTILYAAGSSSVVVAFSYVDKQLYLNINIHWMYFGYEHHVTYYFSWYDNRAFEVSIKNGVDMTESDYKELVDLFNKMKLKEIY